jgi:hypothetical protein
VVMQTTMARCTEVTLLSDKAVPLWCFGCCMLLLPMHHQGLLSQH